MLPYCRSVTNRLASSSTVDPRRRLLLQTKQGNSGTLHNITKRRQYHDRGVYGYRVPKEYRMPDYTQEELANRMEYGSLLRFVQAYRQHGHKSARLDPLEIMQHEKVLSLQAERYGLTDPKKMYNLAGILHVTESTSNPSGREEADFEAILGHLNAVYCGKIAHEFMHLPSASERRWWYHAVESWTKPQLSVKQKRRIHELLTNSETFDHFLAKKFPNMKRYGLEGAESMMVALDRLFELSAQTGVQDVLIGMPHRGRLNLLCNLLEYPHAALFSKMKGNSELPGDTTHTGDVISHLINNPTLKYDGGEVHVSLLSNPSHLEAVNPVVMGKARAKQTELLTSANPDCSLGDRVMAVQIHGDAAFTGQGIVMESLSLSNLPHYSSGGSVHIVVNNQLGYTTPAQNARSSAYCSDIGKMINVPVVHVNGDFPEDVARAMDVVFEYRNKFRKDIILDLICYRRWGHNELDEPAFTQPSMYNNIRLHNSVPKQYEQKLISEENVFESAESVAAVRESQYSLLDSELQKANNEPLVDCPSSYHLQGNWKGIKHVKTRPLPEEEPDTGVATDVLTQVGKQSVTSPDASIKLHPRLQKYHIASRLKRLDQGSGIDWATAEALAFGTLLQEGHDVRISGQDVGRGTFSQRHAMFVDQGTEKAVIPLNHGLGDGQGFLEVANSPLSEYAVLGFEYGMSIESPSRLVIWEAQFGDFFNGAQIAIDTFVSSSEAKWLRQTGLVMLLPHGQDGAGPEHSSARVERFLQMSNEPMDIDKCYDVAPNWSVVNCTTPAQYFHVLRRQIHRPYRKPLIVMSPKGLLKSQAAVSTLDDMAPGQQFKPVLDDPVSTESPNGVEKVVFVSGKLYYDLVKERAAKGLDDRIALIRVEELSPFPRNELEQVVDQYNYAREFIWCQEEPENAGAYAFMAPRISQLIPRNEKLQYVGRAALAAPATGISSQFRAEQARLIQDALTV
ncbi:dehydrogenase E1 and transketolase domain-containing protein 1 [Zychaea mexicana]|uniref:dehydrogenase E1 and transketolase domain-containing protein 1 n=1 Tax=Zychaea mexicana TaxID=64656 RepID=UPI0022FE1D7F|nr:dehydrogenase E1 and transketolase domain-containing protein 1 [Zychaea mexicana]KAI9490360.1 dehydrogenase E1 and transketolase domain-containing protein 1 [Zychaea mexicana]